jgi:hypothetical protein
MQHTARHCWRLLAASVLLAALVMSFPDLSAESASGQSQAVRAIVASSEGASTTTLADTGTLGGSTDAREASQETGSISSYFSGEALHATTIGFPDHVESEASVANVALNIADTTINADFAMSRVVADRGSDLGTTDVRGLMINGVPVTVSGARNQSINISGGVLVINEHKKSGSRLTVNALHVIVDNVADVVVASAAAAQ